MKSSARAAVLDERLRIAFFTRSIVSGSPSSSSTPSPFGSARRKQVARGAHPRLGGAPGRGGCPRARALGLHAAAVVEEVAVGGQLDAGVAQPVGEQSGKVAGHDAPSSTPSAATARSAISSPDLGERLARCAAARRSRTPRSGCSSKPPSAARRGISIEPIDDVPDAVPLDVEERVGDAERHLVAKLRRAERVGVDDDVVMAALARGTRETGVSFQRMADARADARWSSSRATTTSCSRLLPDGAEIFDAHLHLGHDIDGMVGDYDQLEQLMDRYGISRAFMFCLDEPDRHPAFTAANDRTLAFAARSNGRLIPFVRLDLNESPIEEARRCLDAGARGIKLHPRAQSFDATDERLGPVFELAAERRVPILIHGGRGLPPIADGLRALVERYPERDADHRPRRHRRHGAPRRANGRAARASSSTPRPGARSTCSTSTARCRRSRSSTRRDYPYGQQPSSLLIALSTARARRLRRRPAARDARRHRRPRSPTALPLPEPTSPLGHELLSQPMQLARIHQYLSMATPLLWTRQPDTVGVLGLAINACAERNGHAEDVDRHPRAARGRARPLGDAARRSRTRSTSAQRRGSRSG